MPSPFPGMNPYLEQSEAWEDFHPSFIVHARDMLSELVGPNYVVKVETRLYLHELSAEARRFLGKADVGAVRTLPREPAAPGTAVASVPAPVRLTLPAVEVERHLSLEIRDARDRRLITVLELLSPSNKSGADRSDYLGKRFHVLKTDTHLVEIDLRRGGVRPSPPVLPACAYYVLVSHVEDRPDMSMWPIGLRERLPVVPIPLTAPDPDVPLDLQALLHRVYDAADYGKYIYAGDPEPTLSAEDAAWARQFLPASD